MSIQLQMLSEWSQKINLRGENKVWPNHWVGSIEDDIAAAFIIAAGKGRAIEPLAPEAADIVDLMRQVIENLTIDNINPTFEAVVQSIAVMHENSLVVASDSAGAEPAAGDGTAEPAASDVAASDDSPPTVRKRKMSA